jgi:uncharacterized protein
MLTWQGVDGRALESARVLLGGSGLRALGRSVRAPGDGAAFSASYRLVVDEQGVLSRLSVTSATEQRERNLTLNRSEDGYWLLDTGAEQGGLRANYDGALDVDLAYSPMFNTLPIRRLGLHREPGDHQIAMVLVDLPSLQVRQVSQRYCTVSTLDPSGRAVIGFSSEGFEAELVVDAEGIVIDYPKLAVRL